MKKRVLTMEISMVLALIMGTVPVMAAKVLPYGDVNDSGEIDAGDALLILKHTVGKTSFTSEQSVAADVSGEGRIDAMDALYVLKYVVGYIDGFPAEANAPRIEISEEKFPDKTFRNMVREMVHRNYMTLAEISKVTALDIRGFEIIDGIKYPRTITDLTGIEYFTQLEELDCSYGALTKLDVSKNTALKKLNCSYNQIAQLDVSANTALEELYCDGNPIASLNVSQNNALMLLGIEETQIQQVDLENNPALQFVWHDEADLGSWQPAVKIDETNFPDPVFREDVKGVDTDQNGILSAEEIELVTEFDFYTMDAWGENQIRDFISNAKGIEFFTQLEQLNFGKNQLTQIDVSRNTALQFLDLQMNDIQQLSLQRNLALTNLNVWRNRSLLALDVTKNLALVRLQCSETGVEMLDLTKNSELTDLRCSGTNLTRLDITQNPKLFMVMCSNIQGLTALNTSENKALHTLHCANTGITKLDLTNNENLNTLNCDDAVELIGWPK